MVKEARIGIKGVQPIINHDIKPFSEVWLCPHTGNRAWVPLVAIICLYLVIDKQNILINISSEN